MVTLHYTRYGTPGKPPVLLLHGLFGAASNWGSVARRLEADYDVVVPDLRNHGKSPHATGHSYSDMVGDVLALYDTLQIERAIVVGHSMGGKVAMMLALQHPQRVERLGVVDIAPVDYGHNFDEVFARFRAVSLRTIHSRADADRQMDGGVIGGGVRAFLLQNLVKGPDGWAWRLNLDALDHAQGEITGFPDLPADASFDGVTQFIHGALSDYVLPAHQSRISQLFPRVEVCPVEGAGHWVYADQPQGFAVCLDAFLHRT
ncbi:MAG: alpha/beta fold hydrolase [Gammaproteobacteria bacterium]|nr:alpha/beta fold hydrolase [Gammaproteobacteria bacterium]